jgi:F-type H+-transporting ATPase subunit b
MLDIINHLFDDTSFWVAISITICFTYLYFKAWPMMRGRLDQRADIIIQRLAESEAVKLEAEKLLAEYQRRHADAMVESKQILAEAQQRVEQLRIEAEERAQQDIQRHEIMCLKRMEQLHDDAVADIRAALTDKTIAAVKQEIGYHKDLPALPPAAIAAIENAVASFKSAKNH